MWPLLDGQASGFGGGEAEMWTMIRGLHQRGRVRVAVVTNAPTGGRHTVDGIPVFTVPCPQLTPDVPRVRRFLAVAAYLLATFRAIRRVRADAIFLKLPSLESIVVALSGWWLAIPVVFRIASNWEMDPESLRRNVFPGHPLRARVHEMCLRLFARIVCQTRHQAELLARYYGLPATLIPNVHGMPEDLPDFGSRVGVVWVGRAHPQKHPAVFLDLAAHCPEVRFRMVMAPSHEHPAISSEAEARASALPNVEFVPGLPSSDISRAYRWAKVFVLTSEAEGFSNVVIEAMKHGVPVISLWWNPDGLFLEHAASDAPVQSEPALGYCTRGSVRQLGEIVERLVSDDRYWKECSELALAHVRATHSEEGVLPHYESLFKDVSI